MASSVGPESLFHSMFLFCHRLVTPAFPRVLGWDVERLWGYPSLEGGPWCWVFTVFENVCAVACPFWNRCDLGCVLHSQTRLALLLVFINSWPLEWSEQYRYPPLSHYPNTITNDEASYPTNHYPVRKRVLISRKRVELYVRSAMRCKMHSSCILVFS